ncbi:MAG: Asr1405/Asl0597 family protein [Cyanobacteria bacterium P01_A01_bin.40]
MYKSTLPDTFVSQITKIQRSERWSVYRRLQELNIPCWCPQDGSLWVEIDSCIHAILLRSTIQQFVSTRSESIDWLERCWFSELDAVSTTRKGITSMVTSH